MSNTLLKLKIDLMKVAGASKITAKNGKEDLAIDLSENSVFVGAKGGVYLDLDMRENRDGEDQYGNTHMITVSPTKEQREAKERTPIVGALLSLVMPRLLHLAIGGNNRQRNQQANITTKLILARVMMCLSDISKIYFT